MASYATPDDLQGYMDQLDTDTAAEAKQQKVLDRATKIIDDALGFAFAGYATTATARRFDGGGSQYLRLPYYQAGSLVDDSVKPVGSDLTTGDAFEDCEADAEDHTLLWRYYGWPRARYEATAKWGYGDAPVDIVQLCLEVARDLWMGSLGQMSTDQVGLQGAGGAGVQYAWTRRQYDTLTAIRRAYGRVGIG